MNAIQLRKEPQSVEDRPCLPVKMSQTVANLYILLFAGVPKNTRPDNVNVGLYAYQDLYLTSVSGKINGKTAQFTPSNYSSTVILDSGNPNLGLPPSIFNQILPYLPVKEVSGGYGILCKDAEKVDASLQIQLTGTNGQSVSARISDL